MGAIIPRHLPKAEEIKRLSTIFPDLEPVSVETVLTLLRLSSDLVTSAEKFFSSYSLSEGRFTILMLLFRAAKLENLSELSPAEIADRAGVTRATISGLLDKLEKDGLIARKTRSDDRRKVSVCILPAGEGQLRAILPEHFKRVTKLMAGLNKAEQKQLTRFLHTIWMTLREAEENE